LASRKAARQDEGDEPADGYARTFSSWWRMSFLALSRSLSFSSALALYEYVQISISNAINGAKADGCVLVLSIVTHTPRCTSE